MASPKRVRVTRDMRETLRVPISISLALEANVVLISMIRYHVRYHASITGGCCQIAYVGLPAELAYSSTYIAQVTILCYFIEYHAIPVIACSSDIE